MVVELSVRPFINEPCLRFRCCRRSILSPTWGHVKTRVYFLKKEAICKKDC
jgi:hypothetical protein